MSGFEDKKRANSEPLSGVVDVEKSPGTDIRIMGVSLKMLFLNCLIEDDLPTTRRIKFLAMEISVITRQKGSCLRSAPGSTSQEGVNPEFSLSHVEVHPGFWGSYMC